MMSLDKRLLDLTMALLLICLTFPIFVVSAMLIVLESRGPILFIQERAGQNATLFDIIKFRTMYVDKPVDYKQQTLLDDPYVTRVGRVLRRFKIDELPQLWNVVCGDMSMVGPRPTMLEQVMEYTPYQRRRLEAPPGLTGWAQVNGSILLPWDERIDLDVWYVDNRTFWLDVRILWLTIGVVLFGERVRSNSPIFNPSADRSQQIK